MPGVPGIVARASPRGRPVEPLVVPSLLRASAKSGRLRFRFGGCLAAEDRRRRCPLEAWKDDWEASVTYRDRGGCTECKKTPLRVACDVKSARRGICSRDGVGSVLQSRRRGTAGSKVHGKQCTEDSWPKICFSVGNARGSYLKRKGGVCAAVQRQRLLSSLAPVRIVDEGERTGFFATCKADGEMQTKRSMNKIALSSLAWRVLGKKCS
jgi:hypothetical protein